MDALEATVSYSPLRSNLLNLPADLVSLLYSANINVQEVVIELSWSHRKQPLQYAYCGWSGMTSANSIKSTIEIDPLFANSLDLKENTKVTVNIKFNAPEAYKIHLEPISSSDWELVELHAQFLEDRLLNQTRAVQLGQTLVVYPSSTITANLKVAKIEPVPTNDTKFAKISLSCEVIIAPKVWKAANRGSSLKSTRSIASARKTSESAPKFLLRNICLPHNAFKDTTTNPNKFEVVLNTACFNTKIKHNDYVSLSVVSLHESSVDPKSQQQNQNASKKNGSDSETFSKANRKLVARVIHDPVSSENLIGISKIIAQSLGIYNSNANLVLIEPALKPLSQKPKSLVIHPFITKTPDKKPKEKVLDVGKNQSGRSRPNKEAQLKLSHIEDRLSKLSFFDQNPITNLMDLPVIEGSLPNGGSLEFKFADGWFISNSIEEFELELGSDILRKTSEINIVVDNQIEGSNISDDKSDSANSTKQSDLSVLVGYDTLVSEITKAVQKNINGVLIYGPSGAGKSLLVSALIKKHYSTSTHKIILVNLEDHLNEVGNLEVLKRTFNKIFLKLIAYEKVVLVIENINLVCFKESEQGFNDGNSVANNFTEYFVQNFFQICKGKSIDNYAYDIKLVLTSNTKDNLNSALLSNGLLINQYFQIRPPDKGQRSSIIAYYLKKKGLNSKDLLGVEMNDLLNETEGFLPNDLKLLIDRAYHEVLLSYSESRNDIALKPTESEPFSVLPKHFEKALEGFTPSGLRNIKLQQSKVKWDDIGGLLKAKEILLETLEWPTKYAPIFANCPLRLRSGILLYGYPGCGKTLLASAVSSQCGLNFISVKGPEILNKYIGASEQSVRELFERAQAAKPCILFFDEFDSIAPKRGHDSTGVTDRVVNQMLTQMDGAEGLDGVYVLAATSRPDLIDSALLRPGRLDKSVICDMPDFENRLDILETVTNKMSLADNITLDSIADVTEGFSGADLQALCYNAYLNAVHRKLETDALKEEKDAHSEASQGKDKKNFDFFQVDFENKGKDLSLQERARLFKKIDSIIEKSASHGAKAEKLSQNNDTEKSNVVSIQLEDFEHAVKETSPSISLSERVKLQKIYNVFISDRDGNMPNGAASNQIGGRTSLM